MAGNIDVFDEFVDISALERQKAAILSSLKEIKDAIGSLGKIEISAKSANVNFSQTIKNYEQLKKATQEAANASDKLATAQAKLAAAQAKAEAQAKEAQFRSSEKVAKASQKESNANREAVRAYKSLQREYVILRKVAEDFGASLGTNSKQYQDAAKRAAKLNDKLKAIDAGIGNFQRNVGNYASGFSGLSGSINQITRELPAFANSLQTGFLAVSNNLPILFDEIGRTRQQITELRKAGEPAPSLFKAIAGSFFSLGTALSLGVTALTVFGPQIAKFVTAAFKGKEALDQFTESQKLLGEALKEGGLSTAAANVDELRINIQLAKEGLIDKEAVVKQYNESIGETTGSVKSLDEAEQELVKKGDAYIKMMLLKAAAQLALQKAAEKALQAEIDRQKKQDEFLTGTDRLIAGSQGSTAPGFVPGALQQAEQQRSRFVQEQSKRRKEEAIKISEDERDTFRKIAEGFQKDAANIAKEFNFNFLGGDGSKGSTERLRSATKKLFQDELNDYKDALLEASKSDDAYVKTRLEFRKQAADIERQLIEENRRFEIEQARQSLNDVLNDSSASKVAKINAQREFEATSADINNKARTEQRRSQESYEKDIEKIKADSYKKQLEQDKQATEDFKAQTKARQEEADRAREAEFELQQSVTQNNLDQALTALDSEFSKVDRRRKDFQQIEEQFQLRRIKTQAAYQIQLLQQQIAFAEESIRIEKERAAGTGDQAALDKIKQAEENLYGLRIKLQKAFADASVQISQKTEEINQKSIERQIRKFNEVRDIALNAAGILADAASIGAENEKNRIQEQIDLIEKKKQAEIEAINATALSEEEKANKIKIIEARAAAQREQLEIRQRKLEERRARFQKAISIATIIASTAEAVMAALGSKPYTPANLAQAAIIGALGAARAAVVAATPIPKYKDGTKDHPGGLAVVGDGGKKEVVMTPDGKVSLTPNRPTIMDLPKGTIVHPDADAFMRMANGSIASDGMVNDSIMTAMMKAQVDAIGRVEDAIRNKTENHFHPGFMRTKNGNNWTTYINKRVFD